MIRATSLGAALAALVLAACHSAAPPPKDASVCAVSPTAILYETYCPPKDGSPEYLCFVDRAVPF
jgi:hypothetical protein